MNVTHCNDRLAVVPQGKFQTTTIAAIATPFGTGGVAIIRVSGPDSWALVQTLMMAKPTAVWEPGKVMVMWLADPNQPEQPLDQAVIIPFKAPHSFTGEDCVELHVHGGVALSQYILQLCFDHGALPAQAGEFSKRAVLNGRMDLTQAESVLDLIHAQGQTMLRLAAHNLRYQSIGRFIEVLAQHITGIQADMVASIDFPDEVDEPNRVELIQRIAHIHHMLTQTIRVNEQHQWVRTGLDVPLIGLPNAGKSSVFNALLQSDRAIVTEIAGTTRDILRESIQVKGIPITLVDTAGVRYGSADRIEDLGVQRSCDQLQAANTVLYVIDGTVGIQLEDEAIFKTWPEGQHRLMIWNKVDDATCQTPPVSWPGFKAIITTSTRSSRGIVDIMAWLEAQLGLLMTDFDTDMLLSKRQLAVLNGVLLELTQTNTALTNPNIPLDVATVPLTQALLMLEGLLGKDTTESVLDSVFSRFCVGK